MLVYFFFNGGWGGGARGLKKFFVIRSETCPKTQILTLFSRQEKPT
jgi:hypothetical protein